MPNAKFRTLEADGDVGKSFWQNPLSITFCSLMSALSLAIGDACRHHRKMIIIIIIKEHL